MIEFRCTRVDRKNNNTPVLKDSEIDSLAETIISDYRPSLLKEPGRIDCFHFLEFYLGANVEFQDIYYDDNRPVLGATAFGSGYLKVFDRERLCAKSIEVDDRTVIIDNSVMKRGKEGMALFTALHEAGHLWLHQGVYAGCGKQMPIFSMEKINPVVCCRRDSIESFGGKKRFHTGHQWREHQADYFASAVAMPKSTFIPFAGSLLQRAGIKEGRIMKGSDWKLDRYACLVMPGEISKAYGVSKTAAYIKLKKFGFVVEQERFLTHTRLHTA